MRVPLRIYLEFARVAFLKILAYRLRYYTGIVTYFVNVSVYYFIWKAVFAAGERMAGYDMAQMVTYVAVGWMVRSFYFNNIDREMAGEVLEGKIAVQLIKPVDVQVMYLAQTLGESCFRAVLFTLPISVVLFLVYPIMPPASPEAAVMFVLSCLLALSILTLINFIVGTMALQIQSIIGVIRAKYFVVEFLSGLLLPLTFFPVGLQKVISFLPFPHISYTPLQIYLGKARGAAGLQSLGLQALWVLVLFAAGRLYWRFSTRRLSIQGG
jgi:ABC-2 type transport system permease protein